MMTKLKMTKTERQYVKDNNQAPRSMWDRAEKQMKLELGKKSFRVDDGREQIRFASVELVLIGIKKNDTETFAVTFT